VTNLYLLCLAHGLPEPALEVRFAPPRRWRWDLAWEEYRVSVEVQGGGHVRGRHHRPKGYEADCEKLLAGQLKGWLVVWVTTDMVKNGSAVEWVKKALRARGWAG
jgi:very-short-patch-repair endonuclease